MNATFKTREDAIAWRDKMFPRTIENDPILYAIAIIEGYQADLRNTRIHGDAQLQIDGGELQSVGGGDTLAEAGYCQGRIYTGAIDRIKRMAGIE